MIRIPLVIATLVASAPTSPDTFALECKGEIYQASVKDGEPSDLTVSMPDQIFVFSESSQSVLRAMPRRHEFETVCDIGGNGTRVAFSPETIKVEWESSPDWEARTSCKFELDRSEGKASLWTRFEWSKTRHSETEWRMECSPTHVPNYPQEEQ